MTADVLVFNKIVGQLYIPSKLLANLILMLSRHLT